MLWEGRSACVWSLNRPRGLQRPFGGPFPSPLQTLAYVGLLCFTYKFQVALNADNYRGLAPLADLQTLAYVGLLSTPRRTAGYKPLQNDVVGARV